MIKTDPIIAVKDVPLSSKWYQSLFDCKSIHGGEEFDVLVDENKDVTLCLHKWDEHEHPTMNQDTKTGNGLILYFRTDKIDQIRKNVENLTCIIEKDISVNPNSNKKEFSLRDLDGYYLTITEYHTYQG